MKIVITYGTFDLLHRGHINILNRASEMGDYLIVGLSSDEFNEKKGKKAVNKFDDRKLILESLQVVDKVIKEDTWDQKRNDIQKFNADIFVMGNDWQGKFDDLNDICEVVYLDRTPNLSTTEIKEDIREGNY